jgi:hypothetical protein
MADKEVIAVLRRFGPILHEAITNPRDTRAGKGGVGNWKHYTGKLESYVALDPTEIVEWNRYYNIYETISKQAEQGSLFVDDGEKGAYEKGYRLNLEKTVYDHKIKPAVSTDVDFYIDVHAYVGYNGPGKPYNAFILANVYAKLYGKWLLSKIPGSGVIRGTDSVYSPIRVAETGIWFNTSIEPEASNNLAADRGNRADTSMHRAQIHDLSNTNSIVIPSDLRMHFFFWQIKRFMRPYAWFNFRRALM